MLCNSSQWNLKTVAKVRRATFLICREVVDSATDIHKLKADKIEILHAPIALLGQLLRQVLSTPQLFKDAKDRKNFQRVTLRAVKAAHKALLTSNEVVAILDTACEKAFNDARPAYGNPEKDKGLWPARSSNTVEIGSDEMRNAIIRKMDFKVMASFLPLGGCAVVEQWRADVDEVVEAILQVLDFVAFSDRPSANRSQVNRTKETESQGVSVSQDMKGIILTFRKTTQQGTYLTAIDEGEKSLTRTRRLLDQSADNTVGRPSVPTPTAIRADIRVVLRHHVRWQDHFGAALGHP